MELIWDGQFIIWNTTIIKFQFRLQTIGLLTKVLILVPRFHNSQCLVISIVSKGHGMENLPTVPIIYILIQIGTLLIGMVQQLVLQHLKDNKFGVGFQHSIHLLLELTIHLEVVQPLLILDKFDICLYKSQLMIMQWEQV